MLSLENAFVYNTLKSSGDTQTPYKTRTLSFCDKITYMWEES